MFPEAAEKRPLSWLDVVLVRCPLCPRAGCWGLRAETYGDTRLCVLAGPYRVLQISLKMLYLVALPANLTS
jgi:hypothetical protein